MVSHGVSSILGSGVRSGYSVGSANQTSIQREVPKFMQISPEETYEGFYAHTTLNETLKGLAKEIYASGSVVSFGKWNPKKSENASVLDLADLFKFKGKTLVEIASMVYSEMQSEYGPLLRYFLRTSVVYVEMPYNKFDPKTKTRQVSVRKELYTSNLDIAQKWDQQGSVKGKLLTKFENIDDVITSGQVAGFSGHEEDFNWVLEQDTNIGEIEELIPVAKPTKTKGAPRKVVNPQKPFNVAQSNIRFIPLFILEMLAEHIYESSKRGALGIDFLRENGVERSIVTTSKFNNIESVYGKHITEEVESTVFTGDFYDGQGSESGVAQIKLPSIGESKYDSIMRSITLPRVTRTEEGRQPDMTFVNVRIDLVDAEFLHGINNIFSKSPERLFDVVEALNKEKVSAILIGADPYDLEQWMLKMRAVDGTMYLRKLVVFMVAHAEWFPDFSALNEKNSSEEITKETMIQLTPVEESGGLL